MSDPCFAAERGWIQVTGAAPLLGTLQMLAPSWPMRDGAAPGHVAAQVVARCDSGSWQFASDAYAVPDLRFDDALSAATGLLGTLIGCTVALDSRLASLHAAAVQTAAGALLLLGENGAGKSTLAVALAMRGLRFVGDDRLLLRLSQRPRGIGLQLTAKLRLPLPATLGPAFRRFASSRAVLQSASLSLIRFRPEEILPRGKSLRLGAAILLQRDGTPAPRLQPLPRTELLDALLQGCFAPQLTAVERLQALLPVAGLPGFALHYADCEPASDHVARHFA